jgi:hypothetical protein
MNGGRKMNRIFWTIPPLLLATTVAAACGPIIRLAPEKTPAPSYHGTMSPSCAPTDAPSVELRLESEGGLEMVSFNLWPSAQVRRPTTVRFDAAHPIGMATYCPAQGECEQAQWGEVRLGLSSDQAGVIGEWAIGLSGGRMQRGTFEAEWLAIQALCG